VLLMINLLHKWIKCLHSTGLPYQTIAGE